MSGTAQRSRRVIAGRSQATSRMSRQDGRSQALLRLWRITASTPGRRGIRKQYFSNSADATVVVCCDPWESIRTYVDLTTARLKGPSVITVVRRRSRAPPPRRGLPTERCFSPEIPFPVRVSIRPRVASGRGDGMVAPSRLFRCKSSAVSDMERASRGAKGQEQWNIADRQAASRNARVASASVMERTGGNVRFSSFFGPPPSPTDLEITCDRVEPQITLLSSPPREISRMVERPVSFLISQLPSDRWSLLANAVGIRFPEAADCDDGCHACPFAERFILRNDSRAWKMGAAVMTRNPPATAFPRMKGASIAISLCIGHGSDMCARSAYARICRRQRTCGVRCAIRDLSRRHSVEWVRGTKVDHGARRLQVSRENSDEASR